MRSSLDEHCLYYTKPSLFHESIRVTRQVSNCRTQDRQFYVSIRLTRVYLKQLTTFSNTGKGKDTLFIITTVQLIVSEQLKHKEQTPVPNSQPETILNSWKTQLNNTAKQQF